MALPVCPVCHKRAHVAGQQLYCTNCGWNRDAGISALNRSLKMTPAGIVLFALFGLLCVKFMHMKNAQQLAIVIAPLAFGIAFNYVYTKNRLAKLRAVPANGAGVSMPAPGWSGSATNAPQTITAAFPPDPQYQALLAVPRPRRVRMSGRGRFSVVVTCLVVLGFAVALSAHVFAIWTRTQSFSRFHGDDWLALLIAAAIFLFPYGLWRTQRRECDLLENGEVVMASITGQWSDRNGRSVRYEFTDFLGQSHYGTGFDYTGKLQQGMSVPVFYDCEKPDRRIAYCSTLHKIVA